jgi:hypothetical protein
VRMGPPATKVIFNLLDRSRLDGYIRPDQGLEFRQCHEWAGAKHGEAAMSRRAAQHSRILFLLFPLLPLFFFLSIIFFILAYSHSSLFSRALSQIICINITIRDLSR